VRRTLENALCPPRHDYRGLRRLRNRGPSPERVMRVIAGNFKGRKLLCPRGLRVRPTADPIKETMFNLIGDFVQGSTALDVFAGVGTLGIEALSRGAHEVYFVEQNRTALRYLARNLEEVGVGDEAVVLRGDAFRWMKRLHAQGRRYDLVFCDPPYGEGLVDRVLSLEHVAALVQHGGALVIEHHVKEEISRSFARYRLKTHRRSGDTCVSVLTVL